MDLLSSFALSRTIGMEFLSSVGQNFTFFIRDFVILLFYIIFFLIIRWYYMLFNNYFLLWYLKWERVPYWHKLYFNKELFIKYVKVSFVFAWITLGFILLCLPLFFVLVWSFWWILETILSMQSDPKFSIILLSSYLTLLFVWVYVMYRFGSVYYMLVDEKYWADKKVSFYFKEVRELTKGWKKFFILLSLVIIYGVFNKLYFFLLWRIWLDESYIMVYLVPFILYGWVLEMWGVAFYKYILLDAPRESGTTLSAASWNTQELVEMDTSWVQSTEVVWNEQEQKQDEWNIWDVKSEKQEIWDDKKE